MLIAKLIVTSLSDPVVFVIIERRELLNEAADLVVGRLGVEAISIVVLGIIDNYCFAAEHHIHTLFLY